MKRLISVVNAAFLYFCVATVIALVAGLGTLWAKGALGPDRMVRVFAALHGLDVAALQAKANAKENAFQTEQPSFDAITQARAMKSLDFDLRETAIEKGLADLSNMQDRLRTEKTRFQELTSAYDKQLESLAQKEEATSVRELQLTLEAMKPKQAKEQIVKMLDDNAMDVVVAIVKRMPIDKRKKILAEFKQGTDADDLYQILKNIREGEPIASEIEEAREQTKTFGAKN